MTVFMNISVICTVFFLLLLERSSCGFTLKTPTTLISPSSLQYSPFRPSYQNRNPSTRCEFTELQAKIAIPKLPDRLLQIRGGEIVSSYNLGVAAIIVCETILWLKIWTDLARREVLPSTLTRKIIHTGSAPLFILHWPLFSRDPDSHVIAALIPLLQIGRLLHAGLANPPNKVTNATNGMLPSHSQNELVAAVSRTGKQREALGGPLIYSIVLLFGTFFFFRESPVGIVAICQMAAGDGLADIIGRRFGRVKWPFSARKSVAGSLAFLLGGFLCSLVSLWWMNYHHFLAFNLSEAILPLFAISLMSAVIELFPVVDDNISVPIVAGLLSWWWLVPH